MLTIFLPEQLNIFEISSVNFSSLCKAFLSFPTPDAVYITASGKPVGYISHSDFSDNLDT